MYCCVSIGLIEGIPAPKKGRRLLVGSHASSLVTDTDSLDRVPITVEVSAITFFAERGAFSGHVYQPDINHRTMNFHMFAGARERSDGMMMDSMIDSMVYPGTTNAFSGGHPMALFFYETVPTSEVKLWSPGALSFDYLDATSLETERHHLMGGIQEVGAKLLSSASFERTLQVFKRWRKAGSDGTPVTATEVAEFLMQLCKVGVGTIEKLSKFVEHHQLQWLYEVTEEPIEDQLLYLGSLIRAATPMRVAAYDGRHRFNLCCYFASGYFRPKAELQMERPRFEGLFEKKVMFDGEERTPSFEDCALFKPQTVLVSLPKQNKGMQEVIESMKKLGQDVTQGQTLVVETTLNTVLPEFIQFLLADAHNLHLQKFNYKNYWGRSRKNKANVIDENMIIIYKKLEKFVAQSELYTLLLKGNIAIEFSQMLKICCPTNNGMKDYNPIIAFKDHRAPTNVSRSFALLLAICKLLCDSLDNFILLRRFLQSRKWVYDQGPTDPRDTNQHGSVNYFDQFLITSALEATKSFVSRYVLEKCLIDICRSANKINTLAIDLSQSTWPTLENFVDAKEHPDYEKLKDAADGKIVNDSVLDKKSTGLTKKLRFAAHATIFRDMLRTVCHFGYNPRIKHGNGRNQGLQLYVR